MGASPKGICMEGKGICKGICESKNFTVEIKCPYNEQTLKNYIDKNNIITLKLKALTQNIQMRATNTKRAIFCIADHKYEENKKNSTLLATL